MTGRRPVFSARRKLFSREELLHRRRSCSQSVSTRVRYAVKHPPLEAPRKKVTIFIVDWVDKTCLSRFIRRRNSHVRYTRVRSSASRNKFFLTSLSYVIAFVIQLNRYETASVDILHKRAEIYWNQRPKADNRNYLVDVLFVFINSRV